MTEEQQKYNYICMMVGRLYLEKMDTIEGLTQNLDKLQEQVDSLKKKVEEIKNENVEGNTGADK